MLLSIFCTVPRPRALWDRPFTSAPFGYLVGPAYLGIYHGLKLHVAAGWSPSDVVYPPWVHTRDPRLLAY